MRGGAWMEANIRNPDVIDTLTAGGRSLGDWEKVTTEWYSTASGRQFQVHFYRYVASEPWEAEQGIDFKVRFRQIFYP